MAVLMRNAIPKDGHAIPRTAIPSASRVLTAGYVVLDVVTRGTIVGQGAGGTAGNVAANCAWLGVPAAVIARVGRDSAGRRVVSDLGAAGAAVDYITRDGQVETPLVVHQVEADGQHRYLFSCPVCGRSFPRYRPPLPADAVSAVAAFRPTHFFFDRVSAATLAASAAARSLGATVVFEPNRLGRRGPTELAAANADIVKVSGHADAAVRALIELPRRGQLQIISLAEDGLSWRIGDRGWQTEPAIAGPVVDAGGAGDWLTAAFLTQVSTRVQQADTAEIRSALRFGQALATLGCAYVGARGLSRAVSRPEAVDTVHRMLRTTDPFSLHRLGPHRKRVGRQDCRACLRPVAA